MRADTIPAEIHAAQMQCREIIHVRITEDAIEGSITTVPVTPERARNLGKLTAVPHGNEGGMAVVAGAEAQRLLEVLIHPEDWRAILREWNSIRMGREPVMIWGLPVVGMRGSVRFP